MIKPRVKMEHESDIPGLRSAKSCYWCVYGFEHHEDWRDSSDSYECRLHNEYVGTEQVCNHFTGV
jgi:hypothetical protein